MSYTNTFNIAHGMTEFPEAFVDDVNRIIEEAGRRHIKLMGLFSSGEGSSPVVNRKSIELNAPGDLGGEDFVLEVKPAEGFYVSFCKTYENPYDVVVKAILLTAKTYGIVTRLEWDGNSKDPTYRRAKSILKKINI